MSPLVVKVKNRDAFLAALTVVTTWFQRRRSHKHKRFLSVSCS